MYLDWNNWFWLFCEDNPSIQERRDYVMNQEVYSRFLVIFKIIINLQLLHYATCQHPVSLPQVIILKTRVGQFNLALAIGKWRIEWCKLHAIIFIFNRMQLVDRPLTLMEALLQQPITPFQWFWTTYFSLQYMHGQINMHLLNIIHVQVQRNPIYTVTNRPWTFGLVNKVAILTG